MTSRGRPLILVSSWKAVIPVGVPQTLKSMSPRWSSSPRISLRMRTSVAFLDQGPWQCRPRFGDGDAGIHQAQRAAAYGGHRTGTVAFGNLGDNADGVGEVFLSGFHIGFIFRHRR